MVELVQQMTIAAPVERCFDLARSVEVHLADNVHWGAQAVASGGVTTGLVGLGEEVVWRAKHFRVWHTLSSRIEAFDKPHYFREVMVRGPFRRMSHEHAFQSAGADGTQMVSTFRFAAPIPVLGAMAERLFLRRYMEALLTERNTVIKRIAESEDWPQYFQCCR